MPLQWVKQLCLAVVQNTSEQLLLFDPPPVEGITYPLGEVHGDELQQQFTFPTGAPIILVAEHASINVSVGGKLYSFSFNSPDSICGIPNAARNLALLWGVFAAMLLGVLAVVKLWLKRKSSFTSSGKLATLSALYLPMLYACFNQKRLHLPKRLAEMLYYLLLDVVYFIYSQVTDAITIHQVYSSGQLKYFYALLAILVLQYVLVYMLIIRVSISTSIKQLQACTPQKKVQAWVHTMLASLKGVLLSPVLFFALDIGLVCDGLGIPLPKALKKLDVNMFALYRAQSLAESLFNALPQSILQSKLYLMGNDPNGTHVYIDTTLFLFSSGLSLVYVEDCCSRSD